MIRVQVLGRLALEARGEPVHALAAQPLRGSVFLYLCVEREAKRETLVRMFWPDREEDKARRLLSQTLYELKRLVSEDWCSAAGEVVRVEHVTVDAHGFDGAVARQESDRALAYYQGRFLADFQRFDSAEFNAWVDRKAAYYERLHRRTRRERIKQQLQEGDRSGALAVAQRWSELDPLEDEAQHRTIELLHELGRRTEALQSYETYLARLKEVELVPLDDTRLLAARVRESPEPKGAVGVSTVPLPAEPVSAPARLDAAPAAKAWYRRRRVRAGVAVGLLATFAAALVMLLSPEDEVRSAVLPIDSAGSDLSRIAVLYFDDHSAGGTLDYLAKGLTEALIEELSRVEALNVISRNGVKPFQNANATIDSIRRALKVGTIVEGSVQQAGDSIRVGVDLVDARTGVRVDSRTLQAAIGKGFELEDDVVREVGVFLRERLGREIQLQRIARGASSQEAYRLYQTADDFREQVLAAQPRLRVSDSDRYEFLLQSADSMLIAASRLDPRWLEPVLLRGWLAYDRGVRVSTPDGEEPARYMRAAIRIANQVLKEEPENASAYELRGAALMKSAENALRTAAGDSLHRAAVADLKETVKLDETHAAAWSRLSRLSQLAGNLDEAALYAQRALQADAFLRETPQIINRLIVIEMDNNRFTEAETHCRNGHEQFPNDYAFVECHLILPAANPGGVIPMDSAYALSRALRRLDPPRTASDYIPVFRETLIARLWAKNHRPDSANAILARLRRTVSGDPSLEVPFPFDAAHVLLLAGDTATAVLELEKYLSLNPRYGNYVRRGVAFRGIANRLSRAR